MGFVNVHANVSTMRKHPRTFHARLFNTGADAEKRGEGVGGGEGEGEGGTRDASSLPEEENLRRK